MAGDPIAEIKQTFQKTTNQIEEVKSEIKAEHLTAEKLGALIKSIDLNDRAIQTTPAKDKFQAKEESKKITLKLHNVLDPIFKSLQNRVPLPNGAIMAALAALVEYQRFLHKVDVDFSKILKRGERVENVDHEPLS